MKKLITCAIISISMLVVCPPGNGKSKSAPNINGPTRVSPGCTENYTIFTGSAGSRTHCLLDVSFAQLSDSSLGASQINGTSVQVTFNNSSTETKSTELVVTYRYRNKCDPDISELKTNSLRLPLTVRGLPGKPASPSIEASGSNYSVTASAPNAMDYIWSVSGGRTAGSGGSISVAPEDCGGVIKGAVYAINACAVPSEVRTFTIQAPADVPTAPSINGPSSISDGEAGVFSATGDHLPTSWQWQVKHMPEIITFTPSNSSFLVVEHQELDGQTYYPYLQVRVNNICGSSPWSDIRQFAVLGSNEMAPQAQKRSGMRDAIEAADSEMELYVYPNSDTSGFHLSWDVQKLINGGFEKIDIYDLSGKSVKKVRLKKMKDNVISVEEISNGQYTVKIRGDQNAYSQKIMVKH